MGTTQGGIGTAGLALAVLLAGEAYGADCRRFAEEPPRLRGITAAHNDLRAMIGPDAGGPLPGLEWSCELADVAQQHADELARNGCPLAHSEGPFGENLYWAAGFDPTPEHVVDHWAGEARCTRGSADADRCSPVTDVCSSCGHYTQIVWRDTRRVGCGVAACGGEQVWVCNYDPPGNVFVRRVSPLARRRLSR